MNFENPKPKQEKEPKKFTVEEIRREIERFSEERELKMVRTLENSEGVYMYEMVTTDENGDDTLFSFCQKGQHPEAKSKVTFIEATYFMGKLEDGMGISGKTLSDFDEESQAWKDQ